jgi:hypothetical protein
MTVLNSWRMCLSHFSPLYPFLGIILRVSCSGNISGLIGFFSCAAYWYSEAELWLSVRAMAVFRCMLLGHYIRGLERRLELSQLLAVSSDARLWFVWWQLPCLALWNFCRSVVVSLRAWKQSGCSISPVAAYTGKRGSANQGMWAPVLCRLKSLRRSGCVLSGR